MKLFENALVFAITFLLTVLLTCSCSSSKKAAVPCPDFSKKRSYRMGYRPGIYAGQLLAGSRIYRNSGKPATGAQPSADMKKDDSENTYYTKINEEHEALFIPNRGNDYRLQYLNGLTASIVPATITWIPVLSAKKWAKRGPVNNENILPVAMQMACDTIVFKPGNIILGKVLEIGLNEIKYRECENPDGPVISILKSDILVIKYPNGTRDYFTEESPVSYPHVSSYVKRNEGLGLAGFISSIVGLFIASIPLGTLAVVFGSISLTKIKRYPEKYKGRGFALASIIIGLIDVIAMLVLLSGL